MHAALLDTGPEFFAGDRLQIHVIVHDDTTCLGLQALVVVFVNGIAASVIAQHEDVVLGGSHLLAVFQEVGNGVGLEELCLLVLGAIDIGIGQIDLLMIFELLKLCWRSLKAIEMAFFAAGREIRQIFTDVVFARVFVLHHVAHLLTVGLDGFGSLDDVGFDSVVEITATTCIEHHRIVGQILSGCVGTRFYSIVHHLVGTSCERKAAE